MKSRKTSRREFLGASAATALFTIVPRHVLGGPGRTPPSEKLNIAGIGVGGMGASNLKMLESENIVALCDVDHEYAAKTFKRYAQAKVYKDYRVMLDKQKDIDAVVVATPDHTHAVITMAAIRAGKHVYCQKPLTHDVYESRMLAKAAREAGVAAQMGIQGHSAEGFNLICEWIWDGAIGQVREVDAWSALTYTPHGHVWWSSPCTERPTETPPVPETLDWDLWIGPAPLRPYHPCYHPAVWRCWWDFGCGMLGDRGCHTLDSVFAALKLGAPSSVEATCKGGNDEIHPDSAIVTYHFPTRGELPLLKLTWYDGQLPPRPKELEEDRIAGDAEGGVIFKGDKGILMCGTTGNSPRLIPESAMQAYERPVKTLPRVPDSHEMDWVRACKSGKQPGANFDFSGPLTELVLLGNIAKRVGRRIEWDAQKMKITNLPDADEHVRTPYRDGWTL
jgi:predicted dehydrogenase